MNMQLLQKHWPLVHGKKHGKVPGKKGQVSDPCTHAGPTVCTPLCLGSNPLALVLEYPTGPNPGISSTPTLPYPQPQAKHTYGSDALAGGGGGGLSQRLRRAMLAATDAEGVEGGGMGRGGGGGGDGVGTEWSAPGADSTAAPPLSP